jgi:osmotically-inducible protein OsmY
MDNRRGPRDSYRDRSDRNEERYLGRQQGGDFGGGRRQQDQFNPDYRQQGSDYGESRYGQGRRAERDEWSAGDEYGYSSDSMPRRSSGRDFLDEMPGRGEGGRYEWAGRSSFGGIDGRNEDMFRETRGYGGRSMAEGRSSGRQYGGSERGYTEGGRDFWDKASDEVSSWFGDRDAERRREMDQHRGKGPKGYARSDERIKEDVNDRLTDDGRLDATNIDVEVTNREVTLTGHVYNRGDKRRAEDIAESVSGVSHVQNNLRVSNTYGEAGTAEQGGTSDSSSNFAAARRSVND